MTREHADTLNVVDYFERRYVPMRLVPKDKHHTKLQYRLSLKRFLEFHRGLRPVDVDPEVLAEYVSWRLGQNVSPATVNKDLSSMRALLNFAVEFGDMESAPRVRLLKRQLEAPRAFLLSELEAIFATTSIWDGMVGDIPANYWWTSFLMSMYDTGSRVNALLQVRPVDIDVNEKTLYLLAGSQKQRTGQMLTLHEQTIEQIQKFYNPKAELVWPWPWNRNSLYCHFRKILGAAEVETWTGTDGACPLFHRIRKSTASYCQAAGVDPMWQLGHSAPSVTMRYLDPRICRTRTSEIIARPAPLIVPELSPEYRHSQAFRRGDDADAEPEPEAVVEPEAPTPPEEPPRRSARGIIGRIRGLFAGTPDPEPSCPVPSARAAAGVAESE